MASNSPIEPLVDALAELPGVVAVVLGGSRATGTERPDSDWDIGLYYRRSDERFDPEHVRRLGHPGYVSALGEWGPIMHGGAWLTLDGVAVDVLFRDLDIIGVWLREAEEGRFEVLAQNGYVVGAPTYLPVAHARLAARREWVLNEKRLIERAGLQQAAPVLARSGATRDELVRSVAQLSTVLNVEPTRAR